MKPVFVIPAYEPGQALSVLVKELRSRSDVPIVIVDDGSSPRCASVFDAVSRVTDAKLLRHAVNRGKGAALKTAFDYLLSAFPDACGAVTLDADGQHSVEDALKLADALAGDPQALCLGVRGFSPQGQPVPWRSRFGNGLTRWVFRMVTGVAVSDTQTGLRALPRAEIARCLHIPLDGYEFETEMLVRAARSHCKIRELPIQTIYIDGNASSHFNPILDSIRIYYVFARFILSSLLTALIDFCVFSLAYRSGASVLGGMACARTVAGCFNFFFGKKIVFRSQGKALPEAIRYFGTVAVFMVISNSLIGVVVRRTGMSVYLAKAGVELFLFVLSFSVQRLLVFPRAEGG